MLFSKNLLGKRAPCLLDVKTVSREKFTVLVNWNMLSRAWQSSAQINVSIERSTGKLYPHLKSNYETALILDNFIVVNRV